MEKQNVKVSIIVPVYNVASYLTHCLDSLINQTLRDIEIICIDDKSTDNSLEICREYAKKDNRIRVIAMDKNGGVSAARNAGLDVARGEYIGFVDSDDYVNSIYFEDLYIAATKYNAPVAATSNVVIVDFEDTREKYTGIINSSRVIKSVQDKGRIFVASGITWNKIYKKSFLEKNNIKFWPNLNIGEDNYVTIMSMVFADQIAICHSSQYNYRMVHSSAVHSKKDIKAFGVFDMYADILKLVQNIDLDEKDKNQLMNFVQARIRNDLAYIKTLLQPDLINDWQEKTKAILNPVIISLTSYPARIETVNQTIETLLNQTVPADKVVLWLAPEQFPNKDQDLPKQLLDLIKNGLTIEWHKNLRSYTKLIPALKKYHQALIITVDDDILYPDNLVETLINGYSRHPHCIISCRAHRITFNNNKVMPYDKWHREYSVSSEMYENFLTGVGGVLYPPYCLHPDVLDQEKFTKLAPMADDIWFWAMAVHNGTKIRIIENAHQELQFVPGTQDGECLWKTNTGSGGKNDEQLRNVLAAYPDVLKRLESFSSLKSNIVAYYLFGFIPILKIEK